MRSRVIQSIRFNREFFTKKEGDNWIKKHGFKIVPTGKDNPSYLHYHAYRQRDPKELENYRMLKHYNMLFVLAYEKKKINI